MSLKAPAQDLCLHLVAGVPQATSVHAVVDLFSVVQLLVPCIRIDTVQSTLLNPNRLKERLSDLSLCGFETFPESLQDKGPSPSERPIARRGVSSIPPPRPSAVAHVLWCWMFRPRERSRAGRHLFMNRLESRILPGSSAWSWGSVLSQVGVCWFKVLIS